MSLRDEPLAEALQRPLRECWFRAAQAAEHQLPAQIEERRIHRVGVRETQVALEQKHHCELRRRHRLGSRTGVAVHRLELGLELVVEDLVAVLAQKAEELPLLLKPLEDELLLPRRVSLRMPPLHAHRLHRERRFARSEEDHGPMGPVDPRRASDGNHGTSRLIAALDGHARRTLWHPQAWLGSVVFMRCTGKIRAP